MNKKVSYKQRNILLAAGVIVFGIFAYWLAFSETFEIAGEINQNERKLANSKLAKHEIQKIEEQLASLESQIGVSASIQNTQQLLLQQVSTYCQKQQIELSNFPAYHQSDKNGYRVQTHIFEVEGPFKESVKLLYKLEQEWNLGKVVSADFWVKENFRTNQKKLYSSVYLQTIKPLDNGI